MILSEKFILLRQQLAKRDLEAYLIPYTDCHQNEYLPSFSRRLAWLTNFDGSAGLAIVTRDKAAIFVDGRYTLQVRDQVDGKFFNYASFTKQDIFKWLKKSLLDGGRIGLDPFLYTHRDYRLFSDAFKSLKLDLVALDTNLIDEIWSDKPTERPRQIQLHDLKYTGRSRDDKIQSLTSFLQERQGDYLILTQPESICWLLNIRGRDIPFSPLVLSFAILSKTGTIDLFIEPEKVPDFVKNELLPKVTCRPYHHFLFALEKLAEKESTVFLDPDSAPEKCFNLLKKGRGIVKEVPDPCLGPKACKTKVEIQGAKAAHLKDGVALTRFLFWIDQHFSEQKPLSEGDILKGEEGALSELSAVEKLFSYRKEQNNFQESSFDTISGTGANGAIVHYRVTESTNRPLRYGDLYLVDSGGQYLEGTTDVTRTLYLGHKPKTEEREAFTRVLKGHIALTRAVFPKGTCGYQLDALARQFLWEAGLDYAHGTGHGVGSYLGVHEGPQNISPAPKAVPLEEGMILSNEPGYYLEGRYGIRLENLVVVEKASGSNQRNFLCFKNLTIAPFDKRLMERPLLTKEEINWINAYHTQVFKELAPFLNESERAWLKEKTSPLT